MNGSDSNSFPLEARKNKGVILENMTPLFSEPRVRTSREKIISNPTAFINSKLGFNRDLRDLRGSMDEIDFCPLDRLDPYIPNASWVLTL